MGDYYMGRNRGRPSPNPSQPNGNPKVESQQMFGDETSTRNPPHESKCRACSDFQSWRKAESAGGKHETSIPTPECPLDRAELGRHTWNFLHTMAAYYPIRPSKDDQDQAKAFFRSFGRFYPCDHCAEDFRQEMQKSPPRVTSRSELSTWICEQHNLVNKKLGKSTFDCEKVLQRWLTGPPDGSCS